MVAVGLAGRRSPGLGRPDTVVRPLTRGYRVPGEVLEFANRLLPLIAPGLPAATAVRSEPGSLQRAAGRRRSAGPLSRWSPSSPPCPARSASSAPTPPWPRWSALLTAAGMPAAALTDDGDEAAAVAVVPATLAKGLEFDAVVVVDPAAIVAAEPRGLHRLYVVLTRAVSTLVVLHRGDLPAPLTWTRPWAGVAGVAVRHRAARTARGIVGRRRSMLR